MSERVNVRRSSPLQSCSVLAAGSSGGVWKRLGAVMRCDGTTGDFSQQRAVLSFLGTSVCLGILGGSAPSCILQAWRGGMCWRQKRTNVVLFSAANTCSILRVTPTPVYREPGTWLPTPMLNRIWASFLPDASFPPEPQPVTRSTAEVQSSWSHLSEGRRRVHTHKGAPGQHHPG